MKNTLSKNKFATAIALFSIIAMTISLIALPAVSAHNPPVDIATFVYVAVAPNPVGLNQEMTFLFWNAFAPPEAISNENIRWNFAVTVTNPNGNVTSLGNFVSGVEGRASTTFTPDMVGTWNVTVKFPNTLYGWDDTAAQQVWTGDTFLASSFTASFVVQSETVPEPLPVDYYSRGEWFKVTGYYGGSSSPQTYGNHANIYRDNTVGSLTAHVMWTRPIEPGGVVGGNNVGVPGDAFYSGLAYAHRFESTFILDGKVYYREPLGESGQSGNYIIVDLRNGERLLRSTVSSLGMAYDVNGVQFFSDTNYGTWLGPDTLEPIGTSLINVPSGTSVVDANGNQYRVSIVNEGTDDPEYHIVQWNASKVIVPGLIGEVDASLEKYFDFDVPITYNGQPFVLPHRSIRYVQIDDFVLTTSSTGDVNPDMITWMISLKPENRGEIVANYPFLGTDEPFNSYYSVGDTLDWTTNVVDPVNRVIPLWGFAQRQWVFINFETGNVTGPTASETPWNYYASPQGTNIHRDSTTLNGKIISVQYGGVFYCYDAGTGTLDFTMGMAGKVPNANITSSGFQTPYGVYPTLAGASTTANGRCYVFVNEHSPNTPLLKGSYLRCIDVLNQREDWIIPSFGGVHSTGINNMMCANGFTVSLNNHDQQIYAMAKGPSATSVSVPVQNWTQGDSVVIEGTVLDICAGTRQNEQAGRFPNGLAAVSDDSMDVWMEYVYANRPRPDVTGVDVTLTAVGPDGSSQEIGVVTSDSTGYYSLVWAPPAVGSYTVTADFAGSAAYYASNAQTSFTVAAAPEPPVIEPEPAPMTDTYILVSAAGIIVAIAVITGVIALLIKRS